MSLWNKLASRLRHARIARFAAVEKRALVKLAHAVALVDRDLAGAELDAARSLARELQVDLDDARKLGLSEAVAVLAAKPAHLEIACAVLADVVLADGDYDDNEQAFVEDFAAKYHLPKNALRSAVLRLRQQKLDDALTSWHDEIVHGAIDAPKDGHDEDKDDAHREE